MARTKKDKSDTPVDSTAILDRAVSEIRAKWGVGSIHVPGEHLTIDKERLPTGIPVFDTILGGGIARGTLSEIYGSEGAGKSTLCLQLIASAQQNGMKTVYIDMEQVLNTKYASDLGVDIESMYLAQPDSMEQAFSILEALVKTGEIGLVIVDSLASLVPQAELEKEVGEQTMGVQAKAMSTWLRRFNPIIAHTNTIVIFTNQLREKIGGYGNPQTTSGGRAIKFYASYRIEVAIVEKIKDTSGVHVGNKLRFTTVKNKWGMPYQTVEVDLYFGQGVDLIGGYIDTACHYGIINKSGAWYRFNWEYLEVEEIPQIQGKNNVKAYLEENDAIMEKVKQSIKELSL